MMAASASDTAECLHSQCRRQFILIIINHFSVSNSLTLLLGDYNSDSENEDSEMVAKVDEFFNEISTSTAKKRITTSNQKMS